MLYFSDDVIRIIIIELRNEQSSLYSCILVNRSWCRIAMPILWKDPFDALDENDEDSRCKLYNTLSYLLPTSSRKLLLDNNIVLPLPTFSKKPLFNYISFFSKIFPIHIDNMIQALIKGVIRREKYKILEQEIYKLFISNCRNIVMFYWKTERPIFQYPGASICFSRLRVLIIDLQFVNSTSLFEMAKFCQNIEDLQIIYCNRDVSGLINLIDVQKNLQSLYLYFTGLEKCSQLGDAIERKASTLNKLTVTPIITLLSPKFLPSLINLQHLELNNSSNYFDIYSAEIHEWEKYLSISSFPNLQYIETKCLPSFCKDYMLVEKSCGNILDVNIHLNYVNQDPAYTKRLTKAIARNCPKIERLSIYVELENLNEIKEIFLNCAQLKEIDLLTYNEEELVCDELLEILSDYSPKTLYRFSFYKNWIFTAKGLEKFFESWRNKESLVFMKYEGDVNFEEEHEVIIRKYYDEGVIKETNCLE